MEYWNLADKQGYQTSGDTEKQRKRTQLEGLYIQQGIYLWTGTSRREDNGF